MKTWKLSSLYLQLFCETKIVSNLKVYLKKYDPQDLVVHVNVKIFSTQVVK